MREQLVSDDWCNEQLELRGRVRAHYGGLVEASLPGLAIGDYCEIESRGGGWIPAQVISFHDHSVMLAPLVDSDGLVPQAIVRSQRRPLTLTLPDDPKGLVLDAIGRPLQSCRAGEHRYCVEVRPYAEPPPSMARAPITTQLVTGIRGIDALCPLGRGQRVGLFAAPGVGKSTLIGSLVRNAQVDHVVVGLIGERGREVGEFLHETLGENGMRRATLVVSTSDESALRRVLAAYTATAIAESLRAQGKHVLLVIDSLTRTARAWRDLSLARREMPVRQGFTPTVFAELPRLLERAGTAERGSISAVYSVLSNESEFERDALADEVKSILDGHLVLDAAVAARGVRPAIDYCRSVSRLAQRFWSEHEGRAAQLVLRLMHRLQRDRDISLLGGTPDRELQVALDHEKYFQDFCTQGTGECITDAKTALCALAQRLEPLASPNIA